MTSPFLSGLLGGLGAGLTAHGVRAREDELRKEAQELQNQAALDNLELELTTKFGAQPIAEGAPVAEGLTEFKVPFRGQTRRYQVDPLAIETPGARRRRIGGLISQALPNLTPAQAALVQEDQGIANLFLPQRAAPGTQSDIAYRNFEMRNDAVDRFADEILGLPPDQREAAITQGLQSLRARGFGNVTAGEVRGAMNRINRESFSSNPLGLLYGNQGGTGGIPGFGFPSGDQGTTPIQGSTVPQGGAGFGRAPFSRAPINGRTPPRRDNPSFFNDL